MKNLQARKEVKKSPKLELVRADRATVSAYKRRKQILKYS